MDELINRSKEGDENAFTELILSINNDLYKVAKTRLNNDYEINDAIQETIIKAYRHLTKLKDNSKFKGWILKILINECNTIYNRKLKKNKIINKICVEEELNHIDNSIEDSNSVIDFNILLESLNYEERIIITLFYNNRFTCNEISQILNINVNTIKSKLYRTKEKIKKYYEGGVFYE